jgi:hypothetical protein
VTFTELELGTQIRDEHPPRDVGVHVISHFTHLPGEEPPHGGAVGTCTRLHLRLEQRSRALNRRTCGFPIVLNLSARHFEQSNDAADPGAGLRGAGNLDL